MCCLSTSQTLAMGRFKQMFHRMLASRKADDTSLDATSGERSPDAHVDPPCTSDNVLEVMFEATHTHLYRGEDEPPACASLVSTSGTCDFEPIQAAQESEGSLLSAKDATILDNDYFSIGAESPSSSSTFEPSLLNAPIDSEAQLWTLFHTSDPADQIHILTKLREEVDRTQNELLVAESKARTAKRAVILAEEAIDGTRGSDFLDPTRLLRRLRQGSMDGQDDQKLILEKGHVQAFATKSDMSSTAVARAQTL